MQQQQQPPTEENKLPPPIHGTFIGGNKPPGGGFAKFQHLDRRYDGKSLRKAVQRRVIDHHPTIIRYLQEFPYRRHYRDQEWIQRDKNFLVDYKPTFARRQCVAESLPTKFIHTSVNKIRCPVNVVKWTPDGRRLLTGCTSGEITLWNGLMFNFETIMQAHDSPIRCMIWSHNEKWMVSSDHSGTIKYWQPNLNNVKVLQAHREPVRSVTFSPTDTKLASGSDDSTIKIWDFNEAREERMLTGHGWDVKCVDWHPYRALIASGSKDNLIKLWDAKSGKNLSTFHGHKNTILGLQWNRNGNWLVAGSRDQIIKLYDVRMMREIQSFKAHKKEINSLIWHPFHEELFASGGSDGSIHFWTVGDSTPAASLESAHDANVWSLDWHPLGHVLVSGSNDHHTRFWTRNRPEDELDDHYIHGKPESERPQGYYNQQQQQSSEDYYNGRKQQPHRPALPTTSFSYMTSDSSGQAPPGLNHAIPGLGGIPGVGQMPPPPPPPSGMPPAQSQDHYNSRYRDSGQEGRGRMDNRGRYNGGRGSGRGSRDSGAESRQRRQY